MFDQFYYFFICVFIFAIGDFLGVLTRARLSAVFVALILFLTGFMTGVIPKNVINLAGLTEFGRLSAALIIFHMGTMINLSQLRQEWRTVVTTVLSMIVAGIAIFAVTPLIGRENMLVSIPVINGGIVSTKLMVDAAMAKSFPIAAALGMILYAVQKFVGSLPASLFGLKEAEELLKEHRANKEARKLEVKEEVVEEAPKAEVFSEKYSRYFTDFTCIAIAAFFAWMSSYFGKVTPINYSIWALLFGALVGYWGLAPAKILEKGKASGLLSMVLFATIIPSLAQVTIGQLAELGYVSLVVFTAVMLGLFLCFYVLPFWKISGSKNLAMGIAMGQMLGFPATFLISNEIINAVTKDPEEQELVRNRILPAYVVSGFASVTTVSIVIAGILVGFL